MTVVLVEGFDAWADGYTSHAQKGWVGEYGGYVTMVGGRFPGACNQAASIIPNNSISKVLPGGPYTDLVVGCAILFGITGKPVSLCLALGNQIGLILGWDNAGRPQIRDQRGAIVAAGDETVTAQTWHYYEIRVTVAGSVSLNLDGAEEIAATGGGTWGAGFDRVILDGSTPLPYTLYYDDLYVANIDPETPSPLGDVVVTTLWPIADATYSEWTPDTGTDHYARVDEQVADGDTSYVKSDTPGDRDTYAFENIPAMAPAVYAAQLNLMVRKNNAGLREIKPLIRQAAVDYDGPIDALPTSYDVHSWLLTADPAGDPWTATTINDDEYGIELVT